MGKNIRAIKRRSEVMGVSVLDAVEDYLNDPRVKRRAKTTREEYDHELHIFSTWCAQHALIQKSKEWHAVKSDDECISLHEINDQVVYLFLEHVRQTHKPGRAGSTEISTYTLNGYARVIKTFLNWCLLDDQYCDHVKAIVVKRIEKPSVVETIVEAFTDEQIAAMFKACDKEESEHLQLRDRAILSVLLDSGLRASELVTLTIGNVSLDTKDSYVKVLGKGSKWGIVGLGEQARRAIQKYIRMYREPTISYNVSQQHKNISERQLADLTKKEMQKSLLFVSRTGKQLTRSGLYRTIERIGRWAGIDDDERCFPHRWRHTFSIMFMRNGGDIYTLSKLLRHSSVKVTEEYLKGLHQSEARRGQKSVLDNM